MSNITMSKFEARAILAIIRIILSLARQERISEYDTNVIEEYVEELGKVF